MAHDPTVTAVEIRAAGQQPVTYWRMRYGYAMRDDFGALVFRDRARVITILLNDEDRANLVRMLAR